VGKLWKKKGVGGNKKDRMLDNEKRRNKEKFN
jgi:hypothetical protein